MSVDVRNFIEGGKSCRNSNIFASCTKHTYQECLTNVPVNEELIKGRRKPLLGTHSHVAIAYNFWVYGFTAPRGSFCRNESVPIRLQFRTGDL